MLVSYNPFVDSFRIADDSLRTSFRFAQRGFDLQLTPGNKTRRDPTGVEYHGKTTLLPCP